MAVLKCENLQDLTVSPEHISPNWPSSFVMWPSKIIGARCPPTLLYLLICEIRDRHLSEMGEEDALNVLNKLKLTRDCYARFQ